jgi:hypothetical protein
VTVQLYRHDREQNRLLFVRGINQLDIKDSLRNASDALQNLHISALNYVLTGRTDALKAYRESLQDWQFESGTLNLLAGDNATVAHVHDFSEIGNQLAGELAANVSLYDAGSHGTALDRLRKGAAMAYRDKIKMKEAQHTPFARVSGSRIYNSPKIPRQLIYCAGGLYVLGFFGLALLFYLLRTTGRRDARTRSDAVPNAPTS